MSWEVVNQILGLAAIDTTFAQELLKEPLAATLARGFHLSPEEQRVFSEISARNLQELSRYLLRTLPQGRFR